MGVCICKGTWSQFRPSSLRRKRCVCAYQSTHPSFLPLPYKVTTDLGVDDDARVGDALRGGQTAPKGLLLLAHHLSGWMDVEKGTLHANAKRAWVLQLLLFTNLPYPSIHPLYLTYPPIHLPLPYYTHTLTWMWLAGTRDRATSPPARPISWEATYLFY